VHVYEVRHYICLILKFELRSLINFKMVFEINDPEFAKYQNYKTASVAVIVKNLGNFDLDGLVLE